RRLRGSADRIARQGRRRALGLDHWTAQGGLVRGARALEQARSLGQTLHLLLGRRHSRAGPSRRQRAMPADHYRSHTRGQEGACRLRRLRRDLGRQIRQGGRVPDQGSRRPAQLLRPAEHWKHLRTTNVIESSFATVRHRTVRSKGCLSNKTALAMIFKLAEAAEKSWCRLNG